MFLGYLVLVKFVWFLGNRCWMIIGKRGVCRGCLGNMRNRRGGIIRGLGVNMSKGGLGNCWWVGFRIVLKTVMSELVLESMPDNVLTWGD